jgi:hypothetical protein
VTAQRNIAYNFGCGAYYTKHPAMRRYNRQVDLLYRAQSLCRSGVAGKDNQMATLREEVLHTLTGKLVHHIERAGTIGGAGVVAKIEIVVLRQQALYLTIYCETTVARVENTYRAGYLIFIVAKHNFFSLTLLQFVFLRW